MGFDHSSEKRPRDVIKKGRRGKPFGELDLSRFRIESGYMDHLMKERPLTKPDYSKVKEDWAYMNASLKQGTYVRACYPDRVDLLRLMIVGPAGTPYQDGLMFYDLQHSPNFPYNPPMVYDYYLLTRPGAILTWEEVIDRLNHKDHHNYIVKEQGHTDTECRGSTMLMIEYLEKRVLQGRRGPGSKLQNAEEFIKSCYQMVKVIDDPPLYFEDIVYSHFKVRGKFILDAIKAYSSGVVEVGKYKKDGPFSFDDTLQDSERTSIIDLFHSAKLESYLTDAFNRNEQQGPKKRTRDSSRASGSSTKEERRHPPKNRLKRLFSRVINCGSINVRDRREIII